MISEIAVALVVGLIGWAYRAIKPPPSKLCGTPGGPPVTSPRIKLSDGRHLAYKERGVPKEEARYKIIFCHGFGDSKDTVFPYSQALAEELGVYFLLFDRPGYGESDPNPKRCLKSEALDIEELADKLQLGSRFHVFGFSMGASIAWSCLIYIPHRLAGVALVSPFVNYYWSGFPANLANEWFKRLSLRDQWSLHISRYTPWLFYWWMTQKWFPTFNTGLNVDVFTQRDLEMIAKFDDDPESREHRAKALQQGVYVAQHQDIIAAYSKWEIDPMNLANPFPNNEGTVHLWQGHDDKIIPRQLNRYLSEKLPWIRYHEVPGAGHLFNYYSEFVEMVLRESLVG